ncbi:MAG: hypothetical protein ABH950_06430 [Candidatus Altiarchaeota archaeon]
MATKTVKGATQATTSRGGRRSTEVDTRERARKLLKELPPLSEYEQRARTDFRHLPAPELDAKLEGIRTSHAQYSTTLGMWGRGTSIGAINTELGFGTGRKVEGWLFGPLLPAPLAWRKKRESLQRKKTTIPTGESRNFAYLMGSYLGQQEGTKRMEFGFRSIPLEVAQRLQECGVELIGETPGIKEFTDTSKPDQHKIFIRTARGKRHVNEVTGDKKHAPIVHLGAEAEAIDFLSGILDQNSAITSTSKTTGGRTIKYPRIAIQKHCTPGLADDIEIQFKRIGVITRRYSYTKEGDETGLEVIMISSRGDLEKIYRLGLLSAKGKKEGKAEGWEKHKKLGELLAETDKTYQEYGPEEYYAVQRTRDRHSAMYPTELAATVKREEGVEVTPEAVKHWTTKGKKPLRVREFERIEELEKKRPNWAIASYAFRTLGTTNDQARRIATVMPLEDAWSWVLAEGKQRHSDPFKSLSQMVKESEYSPIHASWKRIEDLGIPNANGQGANLIRELLILREGGDAAKEMLGADLKIRVETLGGIEISGNQAYELPRLYALAAAIGDQVTVRAVDRIIEKSILKTSPLRKEIDLMKESFIDLSKQFKGITELKALQKTKKPEAKVGTTGGAESIKSEVAPSPVGGPRKVGLREEPLADEVELIDPEVGALPIDVDDLLSGDVLDIDEESPGIEDDSPEQIDAVELVVPRKSLKKKVKLDGKLDNPLLLDSIGKFITAYPIFRGRFPSELIRLDTLTRRIESFGERFRVSPIDVKDVIRKVLEGPDIDLVTKDHLEEDLKLVVLQQRKR